MLNTVAVPTLLTTCIPCCSGLGLWWFYFPSYGCESLEKLKKYLQTPLTGAEREYKKRKEWKELVNKYLGEKGAEETILDLQVFLKALLLLSFHNLYEETKRYKHPKDSRFPDTSHKAPFDDLHL